MKFSLIEPGQHFSFNGEEYIKSSPLVANHHQTGEQKFFRRADNVQPAFDSTSPAADSQISTSPDKDVVLQAFEKFYSSCVNALDENLSVELADEKNALFSVLEHAREKFLASLGKGI